MKRTTKARKAPSATTAGASSSRPSRGPGLPGTYSDDASRIRGALEAAQKDSQWDVVFRYYTPTKLLKPASKIWAAASGRKAFASGLRSLLAQKKRILSRVESQAQELWKSIPNGGITIPINQSTGMKDVLASYYRDLLKIAAEKLRNPKWSLVSQRYEPDDILDSALEKIMTQRLKPDVKPFASRADFLNKVKLQLKNVLCEYMKKTSRTKPLPHENETTDGHIENEVPGKAPGPGTEVARKESVDVLDDELRSLCAEERAIFEKYYFDKMGQEEIAASMRVTVRTVQRRIAAFKPMFTRLRSRLGPTGDQTKRGLMNRTRRSDG